MPRTKDEQHRHQQGYFDRQYAGFKGYALENWRLSYLRRIFPELGLRGRLRAGKRFLDVGTGGSGYTVIEAARMGASAWGTDLSEVAVKTASRLAKETLPAGPAARCKFVRSAAEKLPFKRGFFDAVSSIAVLEHVVEHEKAMAEIARILKPGGRAYVAVPHCYAKTPFFLALINRVNDRIVGHLRHYSEAELKAPFEKAGLRWIKTIYHAHSVKLTQFLMEKFVPSMKRPDSRLWWALEQRDFDAWKDDRASMISMVLEKKVKS